MNHPDLTHAIAELSLGDTPIRLRNFSNIIRRLEKSDDWVWMPLQELRGGGHAFCTVDMYNKTFIVMFSEDKFAKGGQGISMMSSAINRLIECVMDDNGPDGIAINPFTPNCHALITKEQLIAILQGKL